MVMTGILTGKNRKKQMPARRKRSRTRSRSGSRVPRRNAKGRFVKSSRSSRCSSKSSKRSRGSRKSTRVRSRKTNKRSFLLNIGGRSSAGSSAAKAIDLVQDMAITSLLHDLHSRRVKVDSLTPDVVRQRMERAVRQADRLSKGRAWCDLAAPLRGTVCNVKRAYASRLGQRRKSKESVRSRSTARSKTSKSVCSSRSSLVSSGRATSRASSRSSRSTTSRCSGKRRRTRKGCKTKKRRHLAIK